MNGYIRPRWLQELFELFKDCLPFFKFDKGVLAGSRTTCYKRCYSGRSLQLMSANTTVTKKTSLDLLEKGDNQTWFISVKGRCAGSVEATVPKEESWLIHTDKKKPLNGRAAWARCPLLDSELR